MTTTKQAVKAPKDQANRGSIRSFAARWFFGKAEPGSEATRADAQKLGWTKASRLPWWEFLARQPASEANAVRLGWTPECGRGLEAFASAKGLGAKLARTHDADGLWWCSAPWAEQRARALPPQTHAEGSEQGGTMKVAIVHYWLVNMRGGEKVVEALCELFPQADIFTHVYDEAQVSQTIRRRKVTTTFIQRLPFARRLYQSYLPFMPLALERLDLRGYDLVISSESGPAKGLVTQPGTLHLCYCHSPMRYIWNMYHEYREAAGPLRRLAMSLLVPRLRRRDCESAMRVDRFVANSRNVAGRIAKYYRREAEVVHPPVDVSVFRTEPGDVPGDHYLYVGQLTRYKRADLAIEACQRLGRPLVVVGDGEEAAALRAQAGPNVRFLGRVSDEELRKQYAACRALLFPAEEDFGIVPLEAMACGRPVVALGRGGALETVVAGRTGLFFEEQTAEALARAIERFEALEPQFDPEAISGHARRFARGKFKAEFRALVERALREDRAVTRRDAPLATVLDVHRPVEARLEAA